VQNRVGKPNEEPNSPTNSTTTGVQPAFGDCGQRAAFSVTQKVLVIFSLICHEWGSFLSKVAGCAKMKAERGSLNRMVVVIAIIAILESLCCGLGPCKQTAHQSPH